MALTRPKASQINFDVTNISDPLIRLNSDETGTADKDSGLVIERGDDQNRGIIWDESADQWAFVNTTETGTTSGNVSIAAYAGLAVGQLNLADSAKIYLGTGNDFSLYHNANNSFISDQGTGGIYVLTNDFIVKNAASDETFLRASGDGDVELYYDNSQKLVTTSTGVTVTGTIVATSLTGDVTGDVTGNATTITASANNSTDETTYPIFVDGATGAQGVETDTGLTYNPSSGILTATSYAGSGANLTGISTTTTVTGLTDTTISSATSGQVLKYNGSAWVNNAEGATTTVTLSEMTGDGSDTTLTLEATPTSDDNLLVFVDSVLQDAGAWSRSGTTLTFSEAPASGAIVKAWDLLASTATNAAKLDALTGDGSATAFNLLNGGSTYTPGSENSLIVSVNNVIQEPGSGKDFTVSGSAITFTSAPSNGHAIWIVDLGTGITVNTPADNSVTAAKLNTSLYSSSTGAFQLPAGTTGQRPGSPGTGMIRYNTTQSRFEGYDGSAWVYIDIPANLGDT